MDNNFRFVKSYQYVVEAQIFSGKLTSEGIEVFLRDVNIVDSNPIWSNAVGGVKLFVRKEDFEKASEILLDISLFSIDEKNELIKCPNCGAKEIVMFTSIKELKTFLVFVFSLLLVLMPFYFRHRYKCNKCKCEFD